MSEKTAIELMEANIRELRKQFEAMVAAHRPALWRYCQPLNGSAWDAEDLVQETLAKAFAKLAYFWQPLEGKAGLEHGLEYVRKYSLADWAADRRQCGC